MGEVAVIGLDIAKSVFQVHGVDSAGVVVIQRKLTRARLLPFFEALPRCLLVCPPSAPMRQIEGSR